MALPLEQEIARLRADGFNDDQIKKHFAQQADSSSPNAGGGASIQAPMTGVLGNARAAFSHVQSTIPGLKQDAATVVSSKSPPSARAKSIFKLAGAAVIVAVLGYVIYQEWQIHVANAPITAAAQAKQAQIDAEVKQAQKDAEILKGDAGKMSFDDFAREARQRQREQMKTSCGGGNTGACEQLQAEIKSFKGACDGGNKLSCKILADLTAP